MQNGISVENHGIAKESVEAARNAVIAIIQADASEELRRHALDTLTKICAPPQASLIGCHVSGGGRGGDS